LEHIGFIPRANTPLWKDAKPPAAIEEKAFLRALTIAAETTVRIRVGAPLDPEMKSHKSDCWSGVLISKDGYIATCAHTEQLPGEKLIVVMPDNRQFHAVAVGTNWVSDVGIIKITESGSWPYAELGDSSVIGPSDGLVCAGYPAPDANPLPLVTTDIVGLQRTPYVGWSPVLTFRLGNKLMGGASGGGVFDVNGKLVAVWIGPGHGHRIEMLRAQMDYLRHEGSSLDRPKDSGDTAESERSN
jgi:S1-C subfamily serine protease